jgi:hypothetical protein
MPSKMATCIGLQRLRKHDLQVGCYFGKSAGHNKQDPIFHPAGFAVSTAEGPDVALPGFAPVSCCLRLETRSMSKSMCNGAILAQAQALHGESCESRSARSLCETFAAYSSTGCFALVASIQWQIIEYTPSRPRSTIKTSRGDHGRTKPAGDIRYSAWNENMWCARACNPFEEARRDFV